MELLFLATLLALGAWIIKKRDQQRRIALLARHLGQYQIERNMETLNQGYQRALGEDKAERRGHIWNLMRPVEMALASQISRLADDFSKVDEASARVSKLPLYLPFATVLLPGATFDMREALAVHARGIAKAVEAQGQPSASEAAFTLSAELYLFQHTCHWFCKSRAVASARMLAHHQTAPAQAIAAVGEQTRAAYLALTR